MSEARVKNTGRLSGPRMSWLIETVAPRRFTILLTVLAIFLLLSSFAGRVEVTGLTLLLPSTLLALAAIYSTSTDRRYMIAGVCLASLWAILGWSSLVWTSVGLRVAADLAFVGLSFFALSIAFNRVLGTSADEVNVDAICGGVAIYLLLGIAWALSYRVIEQVAPSSFSWTTPTGQPAWADVLYFSYATLTTLGYGDIVPLKPFARIWTAMEAIAGVLYTAILVARLVSLYRR